MNFYLDAAIRQVRRRIAKADELDAKIKALRAELRELVKQRKALEPR